MADLVGRESLIAAPSFFERRDLLLESLRRSLCSLPEPPGVPRRIAVLLSASRGGSSLLYRLLSRHPQVYSLGGEETPYFRLWGFQWRGRPGESDALAPEGARDEKRRRGLARFMLARSGRAWRPPAPFPLESYARECAERLLLQWPERGLGRDELREAALSLLKRPGRVERFDAAGFWREFLSFLRRQGVDLDDSRYDTAERCPAGKKRPSPPFEAACIEEPPFVIPWPRNPLESADMRDRVLLLKASADCYRVDFLRALFPRSRFLFIHLSRNPAASINGLIEGWLSEGFHSHPVGLVEPLNIGGYSTREKPWTRVWWKFDLPPRWGRLRGAPLQEVAAYQWTSAHRRVIESTANVPEGDFLRLRYEDLLDDERFPSVMERLAAFLDCDRGGFPMRCRELPVVMAVTPPAPGKWRARRSQIEPLLKSLDVRETAGRLGYVEPWETWP